MYTDTKTHGPAKMPMRKLAAMQSMKNFWKPSVREPMHARTHARVGGAVLSGVFDVTLGLGLMVQGILVGRHVGFRF